MRSKILFSLLIGGIIFNSCEKVNSAEVYISPFLEKEVGYHSTVVINKPFSKHQKLEIFQEQKNSPYINKASQNLEIINNSIDGIDKEKRFFPSENQEIYISQNITSEKEKIRNIVELASQKTGVPKGLIFALIKKESDFNPRAISRTGARGLTQLMPGTAKWECKLEEEDLFDIEKNIMCGVGYLAKQLNYFGRIDLALAAYNAGPGAVRRAMEQTGSSNINIVTSVLKSETAPYVQKIMGNMNSSLEILMT